MSSNAVSTPPPSDRTLGTVVYLESPLVIGLAVQFCWLLALAAPPLLLRAYAPSVGDGDALALTGCFAAAFAAGCFAVGALRGMLTYYLRKKPVHFLVGAAGSACLAGVFAAAGLPASPLRLCLLCAATAGTSACCAVATLIWGEAARRRELPTLTMATMLSLLLAILAVLGLIWVIPREPMAFAVVASLCPLASVILMYKAQHDNESYLKPQEFVVSDEGVSRAKEGQAWVETTHELHISKRGFALKLGRSALPLGLAFGIILAAALQASAPGAQAGTAAVPGEAGLPLLGAIAFVLLALAPRRADRPVSVRRTLPYVVPFLLFAAGPGALAGDYATALLFLMATLLWMYPAEITQQYRITPMLTYGFFAGFFVAGMGAALLAAAWSQPVSNAWPLAVIICGVLYLIGCAALITDGQMRAVTILAGPEPAAPAPGDTGSPDGRGADPKTRMPFQERCQLTADIFLLSHRELEILYLLAKGRNAAFIQRELVISEGTVRTHMRNIYHKLGVHSQQELMDLVEGIAAPEPRR